MGGESIYGEPFADEIHSRLKFNRYVFARPQLLTSGVVWLVWRTTARGIRTTPNGSLHWIVQTSSMEGIRYLDAFKDQPTTVRPMTSSTIDNQMF